MPKVESRISACILARNEEHRIEEALRSLQDWTDQILVIDNESEDGTVAVARRYTDGVLTAPRALNFDASRNRAIDVATGDWIFFLDADERVPPRLGPALRQLVRERGDEFEALLIPFKHHFCGRWMRHCGWWPGYTRPQLLKKGYFRYNERLHTGVEVEGRTACFPADDPELAIVHYSYDDLHHYLEKLNRYTDGEAESLRADGASHSWQAQLAHFVHDWQNYYDRGRGDLDGMHGFVLSFLSAFYRFASRAKLWDLRRLDGAREGGAGGGREGERERGSDEGLPGSVEEMLQFMLQVLREGAEPWLRAPHDPSRSLPLSLSPSPAPPLPLLWKAPLLDPSGYADEARQFVLGLIEAGEPIALAPDQWGEEDPGLTGEIRALIQEHTVAAETPAELCVSQTLPSLQRPSPNARFNIARTMFETDRLPPGWEQHLNAMDRIWVPTEFNRETFVRSGVDPAKIAVIPGALDVEAFRNGSAAPAEFAPPGEEAFRFLAVFDWTLHKGWDVLLDAFSAEFGDEPAVGLILKIWSSHHYTLEDIQAQADRLLRKQRGRPLAEFPNIHLWWQMIPAADLPRLYHTLDAFVLPTRGEGWCRPLMEAMAAGLPTICTAWSGVTAFHNERVGYPLPYQLLPVPEEAAREIPIYAGHCWAEPDRADLRRLLRRVVSHPEAARKKGLAAQQSIARRFSRPAVTALLQAELGRCRELAAAKGVPESTGVQAFGRSGVRADSDQRPTTNDQHSSAPTPGRLDARTPERLNAPLFKPNPNPAPRDPVTPVDFRAELGRPLRVRWEGDQALLSSLALVNRELCLGLLGAGDVELALDRRGPLWRSLSERDDARFGPLFRREGAELAEPPDVTVRHHYPPNWERPAAGKLVVIQPWEWSHLPRLDWIEGATRQADEVWAYSRFVRDVYVRSGVPAEKVRVVPLGVRAEVFRPEGPVCSLDTKRALRFLFVGGALERKGADLLLEAYRRAFTPRDDVCLVVKDMGTRTFYQGQTFREAFRRAQADPSLPEVLYLDGDLTEEQLAALYRACACVVLPYRAEGFGLPPLEGMACGLPAIVTAGGPTDDYLDDTMALRIPYRRQVQQGMVTGPLACPWDPWSFEPDLDALVDALRWVRDHPDAARERGAAARRHVVAGWTWEHAVASARERLRQVVAPSGRGAQGPAGVQAFGRSGVQDGLGARLWSEPASGAERESERTRERGKSRKGKKRDGGKANGPQPNARTPERLNAQPVELSLCMIVRDEAARIRECLRSIAPHVDEMVVVDTGSVDRTREIARECGARVFEFPWVESFAAARNASLEQARGAWLFWMDADDIIAPECGLALRELIRGRPGRDAAFQVQVRIPPGPGEFSPSVVDHVKLFPNRPELRFEHRIHEQILPSIRRAGLEVLPGGLHVTHQNYDRSEEGQARKRRRDFRLLELDLQDRPDHPFVLFNLGMTYLYATKEYEVAAHYLRRSLDRSHPADSIVRKAYAMLASARVCQGEPCAALEAIEEGRSHYPEDAELLFQAGQIYQQVGRFDAARRALERLLHGSEEAEYRSVDVGLRGYRGQHELALLYRRMGDAPHCERVLREIEAAHPDYLPARLDRVETLVALGRVPEARTLLSQMPTSKSIRAELQRLWELLR